MPELPEVETVRQGLAPALVDARFVKVEQRRSDLRFPFPRDFAERLMGRRIAALRRRAKYLLVDLDRGETLVMHLGMSGSFRIERDLIPRSARSARLEGSTSSRSETPPAAAPQHEEATPGDFHHPRGKIAAHDHVVLHLDNGKRVTYNDPRRFGFMLLERTDALPTHKLFCNIGVEPLGDALDIAFLAKAFKGKAAPLKAALLDQRLIAGLGNIYVCEALHRAGLSPLRAAGATLTAAGKPSKALTRLPEAIKTALTDALAAGGSSLRDHRRTDGTMGYFQHSFRVYDREDAPCPTPGCKGTIRRVVQSGRSTFYCPHCQK